EKSVHPDLMVGAVRANEELSDEAQNEQAFLFNKAANKRIWKKRRNMSVIAASLLAALSYCAYKFIPPAIDTYKAKTAISRTIKKDIAEENSLISAPLFIESAVYKAKKIWPEVLPIDKAIKETIDNDKEGAEEYVEDTNRKLKEIDHYLSPDCKDELFIPRSRFRKLLSEQTTPEEKKAIAKEFLTRNKNKSYAETLLEDLYEDLKPGMFTQKAAGAYSFHIKFISRQDGLELSTEQDWKKFFTEYFSKETAQRLEKAFADYNNSPAVKNETRLSLPKGSLDALVFAGMIEENLMYKLREYTESNGVKPELLKNDKYLVGMLANYLAQNIDKHKDIAKAFAACLYGDRKVEDAATMTASNNFFEYKYNLPKEGRAAELTWLYFMQKTENVKGLTKNERTTAQELHTSTSPRNRTL
ncbi:MAG: hypothetical protein NTW67_06375, partial [Candidatus Woesearchaeota archaeon]|nr:hypothetical protein [Candidatus Woesearchaeota archaeon]